MKSYVAGCLINIQFQFVNCKWNFQEWRGFFEGASCGL